MKYVNLTGHEVFNVNSGLRLPAGEALRLKTKTVARLIDGNRVHKTELVSVDLPEPEEDTIYIVSALVMNVVPSYRQDIWCPKQVVRENGKVIGCKDFRCKD